MTTDDSSAQQSLPEGNVVETSSLPEGGDNHTAERGDISGEDHIAGRDEHKKFRTAARQKRRPRARTNRHQAPELASTPIPAITTAVTETARRSRASSILQKAAKSSTSNPTPPDGASSL